MTKPKKTSDLWKLVFAAAIIIAAIIIIETTKSRPDAPSGIQTEIQAGVEPGQQYAAIQGEGEMEGESIARIETKAEKYPRAVELVRPDGYINVPENEGITVAENLGKKVIMIDFWTYSCINCQRTLPYLNAWHETYSDDGLLIIGVHTPEFEFEKEYANVLKATEKYGVKYPVVLDNSYRTWTAYGNRYWPHKYLIDIDGFIVYDHIGEGGYAETEQKIRELLEEKSRVLQENASIDEGMVRPNATLPDFGQIGTGELYLGYAFQRGQLYNEEGWKPGETVNYTAPNTGVITPSTFYLKGLWKNNPDNMEAAGQDSRIVLRYQAKDVNIVAGTKEGIGQLKITLDGAPAGTVDVSGQDLYNIVSGKGYGSHRLEIEASPGVMAYTFTFG